MKRYVAIRPFAIHDAGFESGDVVDPKILAQVPGGAAKLVRTRFVVEEDETDDR